MLSELISEIRYNLHDPLADRYKDSEIERAIRNGLTDLVRYTQYYRKTIDLPVDEDGIVYLPEDFIRLKRVLWKDREIEVTDNSDLALRNTYNDNCIEGDPEFTLKAILPKKQLTFYPKPFEKDRVHFTLTIDRNTLYGSVTADLRYLDSKEFWVNCEDDYDPSNANLYGAFESFEALLPYTNIESHYGIWFCGFNTYNDINMMPQWTVTPEPSECLFEVDNVTIQYIYLPDIEEAIEFRLALKYWAISELLRDDKDSESLSNADYHRKLYLEEREYLKQEANRNFSDEPVTSEYRYSAYFQTPAYRRYFGLYGKN